MRPTMYLGQKVVCMPITLNDQVETHKAARKPQTGKIVYIHPARRWIVVEFGPVRESFFWWDVLQFGR